EISLLHDSRRGVAGLNVAPAQVAQALSDAAAPVQHSAGMEFVALHARDCNVVARFRPQAAKGADQKGPVAGAGVEEAAAALWPARAIEDPVDHRGGGVQRGGEMDVLDPRVARGELEKRCLTLGCGE